MCEYFFLILQKINIIKNLQITINQTKIEFIKYTIVEKKKSWIVWWKSSLKKN